MKKSANQENNTSAAAAAAAAATATAAIVATDIAYIKQDIRDIKTTLKESADDFHSKYVSKEEFTPIRSIVYGLVGLILIGFVGAMVALVLK